MTSWSSIDARVDDSAGLAGSPFWLWLRRLKDRVIRLRGWRRWGLSILLGAISVLALPPVHFIVALVPAFGGLIWLLDGARSWRGTAAIGWCFGLGFFTAGLYWITYAFLTRPDIAWLGPIAVVSFSAALAFFCVPTALITRAIGGEAGAARVVLFASAWTFMEWVRSWIFTGFPWNPIGSVWMISPAMLQVTAVIGTFGLSLVTVLAATLPATVVSLGSRSTRWVTAAFALLAVIWLGGVIRLQLAGHTLVTDGVWLRLVQPNISQTTKWRRDLLGQNLLDQLELGAKPGSPQPTDIIWSEVAAPMFLAEDPERLRLISQYVPVNGLILIGTLRRSPPDSEFHLWNSLIAVDANGKIEATYDKSHLVPFGEYMPFREYIDIANFTTGFTDFSPGPGIRTMRLKGLPPVSPLICYEAIFPGSVARAGDRPDWLLNVTNDGWYGNSAGPYQHFAAARLRAVEEGLPMVRVANSGISAIVDPYGRIVEKLGLGRKGIVDGPLPRPVAVTPFGCFGNLPVVVLCLMLGFAAWFYYRRK